MRRKQYNAWKEVCSRELSEALDQHGVPRDSAFWKRGIYSYTPVWGTPPPRAALCHTNQFLRALLPKSLSTSSGSCRLHIEEGKSGWHVSYKDGEHTFEDHVITERYEGDAYAKMILYLLEKRIINPEDLYS